MALDSYTKTLLEFSGANDSTVFIDSAGKEWRSIISGGNGVKITTSEYEFPPGSGTFPGLLTQGLYLYNNTTTESDGIHTTDSDFDFGSGDYTIDFWMKTTNSNNGAMFYYRGDPPANPGASTEFINVNGSSQVEWLPDYTLYPSQHTITCTSNVCDGVWHHISCVRYGNVFTLRVDGSNAASATFSYTQTPSGYAPFIGNINHTLAGSSIGDQYTGFIDEFRVSKGIARWTTDFTPPIHPYTFAPLNTFTSPPARDGTAVQSVIDTPTLLNLCSDASGGTYFDSTSKFRRVDLTYYDSSSREKKTAIHQPFSGMVEWSSFAKDGTWSLSEVRAYDTDGADLFIPRSVIGSDSDIVL